MFKGCRIPECRKWSALALGTKLALCQSFCACPALLNCLSFPSYLLSFLRRSYTEQEQIAALLNFWGTILRVPSSAELYTYICIFPLLSSIFPIPRSLVSYTSMHCKKMFKFLFISIFLTRTLPFSIRFWKNSLFLKILENTFWTVYRAPPSLETNIGDGNRFADMFYIYINIYTANCFCLIVHW